MGFMDGGFLTSQNSSKKTAVSSQQKNSSGGVQLSIPAGGVLGTDTVVNVQNQEINGNRNTFVDPGAVELARQVSLAAIEAGRAAQGDATGFALGTMQAASKQNEEALKSIQSMATEDSAETLQLAIKYGSLAVAALVAIYLWKVSK